MSKRIHGLDLARGAAVFGMAAVNLPLSLGLEEGPAGWLSHALSGRAAAVFVVLAGVGMSLMSKGRATPDRLPGLRRTQLKRAAFLGVLGLAWFPLWPADILHYYAVWLAVGAALWAARDGVLLAGALVTVLVYPVLFALFDFETAWNWETLAYADFWTPRGFLRNLLFNGFHPVFPWLAFLLFGMWLGRRELGDPSARARLLRWLIPSWLAVEGLAIAATLGLERLGLDHETAKLLAGVNPIPPMPTYLFGAGFQAALVILACIPLAERLPRLTEPLQAVGRHALSHYVAHVLLLIVPLVVWQEEVGPLTSLSALAALGVYMVVGMTLSVLWSRRRARGPLEWLMRRLTSFTWRTA